MSEPARLSVYRFDSAAVFEGGLLAALERMELDRHRAAIDGLFVRRDAASGDVEAVDMGAGGADATLASLLDFRLDPGRRRALTERTLAEHPRGVPRTVIESVASALEPGDAVLALVHAGPATVLEDAVARCGGWRIADEPADARTLAQMGSRLCAAVGSPPPADAQP